VKSDYVQGGSLDQRNIFRSLVRTVFDGHPGEGFFATADMPDTREGQVSTSNPGTVMSDLFEQFFTRHDGLFTLDIEADAHFWMLELHGEAVDQVTHEQNALAVGAERVTTAAGCMAGQADRGHAGHQRLLGGEGFEPVDGDIGGHRFTGDLEEATGVFWGLVQVFLAEPVIGLRFRCIHGGVGEHRLVLGIDQAADMIDMLEFTQRLKKLGILRFVDRRPVVETWVMDIVADRRAADLEAKGLGGSANWSRSKRPGSGS